MVFIKITKPIQSELVYYNTKLELASDLGISTRTLNRRLKSGKMRIDVEEEVVYEITQKDIDEMYRLKEKREGIN